MKDHERTLFVQKADAEISIALWQLPVAADLTPLELARILNRLADRAIILGLRQERHPNDPDKGADDA